MGDDSEKIVGAGDVHSGGTENIFGDEVGVFLTAGALEDAANHGVAISAVYEFCAGFSGERIVFENGKGFFHRGEMAGAVDRDVVVMVGVVPADPAEVTEELPGGNGGFFLREGWTVFLDGSVQIE